MPIIKHFSSPHWALLWLLARQSAAMLIGLGVAWVAMAYFLTLDMAASEAGQKTSSAVSVLSNSLLFITLLYRGNDHDRTSLLGSWNGVHAQLPVFWPQLVRADLYFIALSATFLSLCFLIGSSIADPSSLLSGLGILYVPALWMAVAVRPVISALSSVVSTLTKIALAVGGLSIAFLVIYLVLSLAHYDGAPMPKALPLTCLVAIPVVMLLARAGLMWAGPRLWRLEVESPLLPAPSNRLVFVKPPRFVDPFETTWEAQQWFFARRLAALATQTAEWLFIALSLLLVFFLRFGLNLPLSVTPYIAGLAGFVYLANIRFLERTGSVHNIPVSAWTATVNHLSLITVCFALLYAASFPVYAFELVSINGPSGVRPMDAFWLLWILWAGLSYAPFLLAGSTFMLRDVQFPPEILFIILVAAVGVVVWRDLREGAASRRDALLAMITLAVGTTGLGVVNTMTTDSAVSWTAREIIGGITVLALLRYNVATHRTAQIAALRICALLALCMAVAIAAIHLLGPSVMPNRVVGLFLGTGVVAPLFLPLLWIPHTIEWARARGGRAPEPSSENEREIWENLR